jgi:16S rRNA (cytidine1402-2'-O)-methyltransferase
MRGNRQAGKGTTAAAKPRCYHFAGQSVEAPPLARGLHIVSTPIGNLRDVTLRALETLAAADTIACEDTRVTGKLTRHYGIDTPLTPYHEHNAATARPKILALLGEGKAVALVSDAGTPLISDPGFKLVRAVHDAAGLITVVPGASAVLAALTGSGLPTDRFTFEGFLPPKQAARQARIASLVRIPTTLVLFESGPRLAASLADLTAGLGPRPACVCRELTKLHEEMRRGDLAELAAAYAGEPEPRGEIVIVVAPPPEAQQTSAADIDALLRQALARGSVKTAVAEVAAVTGEPRGDVYRQALAISREGGDAAEN